MDDLKVNLPQELDFNIEARNGLKMAELFAGNCRGKVPKVYTELSSDRVLTMEFVTGSNVDDLEEIKKMNLNPAEVSGILGDCFA